MVKISIELDDIVKGEWLRKAIIEEIGSKGLSLPERHAGLCLDDMAEIASLSRTENKIELKVKCNNGPYTIRIQNVEDDVLRAGLSCLYGYGHVKYNYNLPLFQILAEKEVEKYMELAVEIWERNIHTDWMKKCGYKTHNGTKDELFFYQMIEKDVETTKKTHWERSERREKGDTPHHIFRDSYLVEEIIRRKGSHRLSKYLIESFYDQATAVTRYWYKLKKEYEHLIFEERLIDNMEKGYYIAYETDIKTKIKRWKPGAFGFRNEYEDELWQLWLKVHDEFKEYWINKFGKNEELWQPPTSNKYIKKIKENI